MGIDTKIQWADHTFNPWLGCTKVSPACDHCYAESWAKRIGHHELWTGKRRRTSAANWRQPLKWAREAQRLGIRQRVFCASLADVFDNQVPTEWREDLWDLISLTPHLDWLLLTKRPQNISKMLPSYWDCWDRGWPNVWLGTTAENQEEADRRVPHLMGVDARVHFLSIEPLLGPISLLRVEPYSNNRIEWVIIGGESGGKARPFVLGDARNIINESKTANVPCFVKQLGSNPVGLSLKDRKGGDPSEWPEDLRVREFPWQKSSEQTELQ